MGDGLIRLDRDKLQLLRIGREWTPEDVVKKSGLAPRTVRRALAGEGIRMDSAVIIAKTFKEELLNLLAPSEIPKLKASAPDAFPPVATEGLPDWELCEALSPWITASNGLQYQVSKLRHRHLPNRWARGKCYDLRFPPTREQERLREILLRHARVCNEIGRHPQIAVNLNVCPSAAADGWWVIDEWIEGPTLAEVLGRGPLTVTALPRIMRQIAEGLLVLHRNQIVRRELSPRSILLRNADETAVLTDFELGKLFDGSPTVSNDWENDPYRAPEVGSPSIDARADVFSWGRILVHAATGKLPPQGEEKDALDSVKLPQTVRAIVNRCIARPCSERPKDMQEVLTAIRGWK